MVNVAVERRLSFYYYANRFIVHGVVCECTVQFYVCVCVCVCVCGYSSILEDSLIKKRGYDLPELLFI